MQGNFSCKLKNKVEVVAHRLSNNQTIKIHNDYIEEPDFELESHRLLIQLNRWWSENNGGFLILFNSYNATDIHSIILPEHRSMFAFEISPNSFHAVSETKSGLRFTLIYNFFRERQ